MTPSSSRTSLGPHGLLGLALLLTVAVYWPGLSGGWLFDDYPNIVDNRGVQPPDASISSLARAALSSPASEFKRPLASLSFAANYLATGLNPFWMKLTNLLIHLLNGLLVFSLTRRLLGAIGHKTAAHTGVQSRGQNGLRATIIATVWMLLPINLTAVLYVVQRMESMANAFVLLGLLGYVSARERMLAGRSGLALCALSLVAPTALGLLAKETAVMLPLYAFLIEWIVFNFHRPAKSADRDTRVLVLFAITLLLPMLSGLALIIPHVLSPAAFSTRDFTLGQRLLSETRIVSDYIGWTLMPTPSALSFYHDDFRVSTSLLKPWTTLAGLIVLSSLAWLVFVLRHHRPLVSLGLAFFLGCHLLTGTILPLELIYEHRNYFASFGLLLAVVQLILGSIQKAATHEANNRISLPLIRFTILGCLAAWWIGLTFVTSEAWGDSLRLAQELAARAPESPRAQYELGRTYIIYSQYNPRSPFTRLAYAPLERAMRVPSSSILPEQALIFMNARMHLPIKDDWWNSMVIKLKAHEPGVQDESSLGALTQCAREGSCRLSEQRMMEAFLAALSHPRSSARLLAIYGDYAWNVLGDRALGERVTAEAVEAKPDEPAYRITLTRMLAAQGRYQEANQQIRALERLNVGGRLDQDISTLRQSLPSRGQ